MSAPIQKALSLIKAVRDLLQGCEAESAKVEQELVAAAVVEEEQ